MIGIYKITSPSRRIYIGQSVNINSRYIHYKNLHCKTQIKIYNSIVKYGWENHKFEVIEECEVNFLNERERYWQEHYDVIKNGLNCKLTKTSNKSGYLSEESRLKLSKSLKGRKLSLETKEKLKKRCGDKSHWWGKKISQDHKEKLHNAWRGKKHTDEFKKEQSIRMKNRFISDSTRNKFREREYKYILDLETGIFYKGVQEAAFYNGYVIGTLYQKLGGFKTNNTKLIYV